VTAVAAVVEPPQYPLELEWVDLSAYRSGNTGIDYVHSIDSGVPGHHVMVNALTHGNELCGMLVVKRLLDMGLRPRTGRLTLSFANVAAYESPQPWLRQAPQGGARKLGSGPAFPHDRFAPDALASRCVDRDFNRLWSDDLLARDHTTVEARRAHAMLPVVRSVDRLLDLHSTWHAVLPFFVLSRLPRVRRWADHLAVPARQLLLPEFRHEGYHLIDYGAFADPDASAIGLIAECGQHFAASSAQTAWQVAIRFLQACACIGDVDAARLCPPFETPAAIARFEIVEPVLAASDRLRLTCSYAGFVQFSAGEVAAVDGDRLVTAPFDGAVLLAPRPSPRAGQQAFAWGRHVVD